MLELADMHLDISLLRLADILLFVRSEWWISGITDAVTAAIAAAPPSAALLPNAATGGDWNISFDAFATSYNSTPLGGGEEDSTLRDGISNPGWLLELARASVSKSKQNNKKCQ